MSTAFLSALDPTLISGVKDRLAQGFANKIDDALAEIADFIEAEADASAPAKDKRRFRESARLLATAGSALGASIANHVRANFADRLGKLSGRITKSGPLSLDALTLVDEDQMQEDITVSNCVKRLRDQSDYQLFSLTQRMGMLLGRERLADSVNPVYPGVLVEGLMAGLASFCPDSAIRVFMFKAFGPILLDLVPDVYGTANEYLIERGIDLPVDSPYGRPILTPDRAFTSLPIVAAGMPIIGEPHGSVINALGAQFATVVADPSPSARPPEVNLNATTSTRLLHYARNELERRDISSQSIVMSLVETIFAQWLQDSRMSPAWKQVIAKTRGPILAIALRDPAVFSSPHHEVRELIDLVTEFGLTIGANGEQDASLQSVTGIIDYLASHHESCPDTFATACRQLDELLYHHEEAALHRDAWLLTLLDTEEREVALSAANVAVEQRLQQRELTSVFRAFVQNVWRDVLVNDFLNGGERGESWRLGLATLDELLKSLAPASTREEKTALLSALPSLICLLQEGVSLIDPELERSGQFFTELEQVHVRAVNGLVVDLLPDPVTGSGMVYTRQAKAPQKSRPDESSAAATLASLGLACGAWINVGSGEAAQRLRLNWITPAKGTCVFRHYESDTVRSMTVIELKRLIETGQATVVKNVGFANSLFLEAFKRMARGSSANVIANGTNDPATPERAAPPLPGRRVDAGVLVR